jgi:hypothetical protein
MYDELISLCDVLPMRSGYGVNSIGREDSLIVGPNNHDECLRIIETHGDETANVPSVASGVTDFELQKPGGLYKSMLNGVIVGDLEIMPEGGNVFAHAHLYSVYPCEPHVQRGCWNWAQRYTKFFNTILRHHIGRPRGSRGDEPKGYSKGKRWKEG